MIFKNLPKNIFVHLFFLLLAGGATVLVFVRKGDVDLYINQHLTSGALDFFFHYFTYVGDGAINLLLIIIFLFVKYRHSITVSLASIFQLLLVHINKRIIFSSTLRPKLYLQEHTLHFVEGVNVHGHNSFPSGHTTTAFSVFFFLSLLTANKKLQVLCFLLAFLVGFSRMYLLQHFFIDVYFGSIFGIVSTFLSVFITEKYFNGTKYSGRLPLTSRL